MRVPALVPGRVIFAAVIVLSIVGAWPLPAADAARPLADRVVIRRDTFGIPHITGETEAAVGFGFGYAQAEDHAAEMARRFLAARGEAARHFGPTALDGDLAARRLDSVNEARRALRTVDNTFREVLAGFAEGYNLYVRQHRGTLPEWVIEIDAADALLQSHGGASAVASPALVRALQQKYPRAGNRPRYQDRRRSSRLRWQDR